MANKILWVRTLSEVLKRETKEKEFTSKKGTTYSTECVPQLDVIVIGTPTEKKDENGTVTGYSYQVYDRKLDASFSISAPNLLEGVSFKAVAFLDVRGGALQNRAEGWFSASRVAPLKKQGE